VIARPIDEVLGVPSYFALGFLRPGPEVFSELSPRAFGAPRYGRLVRVCRSRRSGTPTWWTSWTSIWRTIRARRRCATRCTARWRD